jgi:hypothetical protein
MQKQREFALLSFIPIERFTCAYTTTGGDLRLLGFHTPTAAMV